MLNLLIIIITIFSFYITKITITNVSKRFTNILLPRSLDSVLACTHCVHNLHSCGHYRLSLDLVDFLQLCTLCCTGLWNMGLCMLSSLANYFNLIYLIFLMKRKEFTAAYKSFSGLHTLKKDYRESFSRLLNPLSLSLSLSHTWCTCKPTVYLHHHASRHLQAESNLIIVKILLQTEAKEFFFFVGGGGGGGGGGAYNDIYSFEKKQCM